MHLGNMGARLFRDQFPDKPKMPEAFERMDVFMNPADKGVPLKPGFQLYIGAPHEQPDPKHQFRFDVALNEPGIIKSKSLLETIHQLATTVEGVVTALAPRLRDTP